MPGLLANRRLSASSVTQPPTAILPQFPRRLQLLLPLGLNLLLPPGQHCEVPMSFLILRDGKVIFDGDLRQLAQTQDEYIREYIS